MHWREQEINNFQFFRYSPDPLRVPSPPKGTGERGKLMFSSGRDCREINESSLTKDFLKMLKDRHLQKQYVANHTNFD